MSGNSGAKVVVSQITDSRVPDILYIMGTGRSGTTILEILLANNPGVFGVGEVTHIFQDGFINDEVCSCGTRASSCPFWSVVRGQCSWSADDVPILASLFRSMAWHARFPFVAAGLISRQAAESYRRINECLFRAAAGLTGANVVVDSSKYAGRALSLVRALPGKVRVICLTRKPSGIIGAFQKQGAGEQKPKSITATFLYYAYVMVCLRVSAWQLGSKVLHVRYEDLVADPIATLSRIEKWCGYDLSRARDKLIKNESFNVGHIVTGNRLRRQGVIRFNPRTESKEVQGNGARFAAWAMDLWRIMLRF